MPNFFCKVVVFAIATFMAGLPLFSKTIYVAGDAEGLSTGADWENAFTNIQEAVDASEDGDSLQVKEGTYKLLAQVAITNGLTLRIAGGYTGNGDERGEGYSVLARDSSVTSMRIVYIKDSNVILDGLVVSNGLLRGANGSSHYGLGVRADNSTLMITNCIVTKNSDTRNTHHYFGGGLRQSGGTLTIVDSIFNNNVLASASDHSTAYGGAIYAENVTSDIRNSKFINNQVAVAYINCQGGALWFSGGSSTIRNCVFDKNSVKKSEEYSGRDNGYGGCIYAKGLSTFIVEDCIFTGNFNNSRIGSTYTYGARGGTFYLEGSSMKTAINRCAFYGNGSRAASTTLDSGSIYLNGGTLGMTNVLQAACKYGDGIEVLSGTLNILNCTIASITNGYAIRQSGSGAKISVKNSILEGGKGAYLVSAGTAQSFNNCLTSHELPAGVGVGNVVGNALFGDSVYFHPRSQAGRYDGGWFTGGSWIQDEDDCPSIDMGDKDSPIGDELQPNRHTVNIGYDGSMAVASKSYLGTPAVPTSLAAYLYPLEDIAATSTTIKWETAFAVGGQATATLYWGEVDGGTDVDAWPNCRELGTADDWQLGTAAITGLSGMSYLRVKADDGVSTAWSDVREFKPATPPTLQNVEVSHITRQTMRVVGTLANDGGVPTTVSLRYWPSGNEDAAMVMDYDLGQTVTNGTEMVFEVTGLTAGLYYEWVLEAKNAVGAVGEIKSIQTMTTAPMVVYVTPEGAGIEDGSSWDNAFSKLQDAIDVCVVPGDLICLKEGEYADFGYYDANDLSQSLITDIPGLTIRGGYTGNGDERGGVTILTRNLNAAKPERRHFSISNSTVAFEDLTFTNGCIKANGYHGQSINSSSSSLTFRNCKFIRNGYIDYAIQGSNSGGAIYASKGSLIITNSIFDTDTVSRAADNSYPYGGALYLSALTAVISDCVFTNCLVKSPFKAHGGGAITVVGASNILIERSTFNKCFIVRNDELNNPRDVGYGGAIQIDCTDAQKTNFTMRDCVIDGSYARTNGGKGGVIYISGSKVAVNLDSVAITRAGNESIGAVFNHGNIYLVSGTLNATNLLFASTSGTNSILVAGGTANIVNATIVDGLRGYGIRQTAGTVNVLNSILWGHKLGGTLVTGGTFNQSYCNNQDGANLANNVICEDPRFRYNEPLPYALSSGSPSIDAGAFDASHAAGERDLAGKRRYRGRIDHGCYEFSNRGFSVILR